MNRSEYDAKKAELLQKRNSIDNELDALRDSYHENELEEYKQKYNDKYILEYARNYFKNPGIPAQIVSTNYTIFKVNNVTLIGNGFFRFDGQETKVELFNILTNDCDGVSITSCDGSCDCSYVDKILTKEEAIELIKPALAAVNRIIEEHDEELPDYKDSGLIMMPYISGIVNNATEPEPKSKKMNFMKLADLKKVIDETYKEHGNIDIVMTDQGGHNMETIDVYYYKIDEECDDRECLYFNLA